MQRNVQRMNALQLRKQLLIAESELNRIQFRAASAAVHSGLHTITHGATTVGAMAASAAILATDLAAAISRKQPAAGTNTSGNTP